MIYLFASQHSCGRMSKCHQSHSQTERCASEMRNDQTVKNMRNLFRSKYAESVAQHPACPFHVLKDNPSEGK